MNLRQQLETLVKGFADDLSDVESDDVLESVLHAFVNAALPVIKALDEALTGKTDCTALLTPERLRTALEDGGGCHVVYLSDGGYSRLCIDPWAESGPLVGLDRSLSLKRALDAWDAM